jgi:ABC-type bacteriocin/lantibiotic exporter with double-glycine peptidase domain
MKHWIRFFQFFKPHLALGFLLLILLIIGNFGALVSPYFLKLIIDKVFGEKNYDLLIGIIGLLLLVYVVRVTASYFADYLYTHISNKITVSLTRELFSHILQLPISYFKKNAVGTVVYKINNEVGQVRRAFTGSIISMINNFITIVGLIVLMALLSLKMFIVISILYPFLLVIMKAFSPSIKQVVEKTRQKESDLLAYLTERFSNIKFIKLFYAYRDENARMTAKMNEIVDLNLKATVLSSASNNLSVFLLAFIPLAVLGYGGKLVIDGLLTLGTLIAFLQYANKLHEPFRNIVSLYVDLVKTSVSIKRLFDILDEPVHFPAVGQGHIFVGNVSRIEFQDIEFSHGDQPVLSGLNLAIETGKHYAIVGPSGSGKSTLIDLLTKLTVPSGGKILVDGIDLNEIVPQSWMNLISLSAQEYFILNDTLFENARYGNSRVDKQVLETISQRFKILGKERITDSVRSLGENGSALSGGQKQKLSIIRNALRNPQILILDEATSEVDALSEEDIIRFLKYECRIGTLIMVTHRLGSLRFADEIVFMDGGKILERGSFDSLVQKKGRFYQLFRTQLDATSVQV